MISVLIPYYNDEKYLRESIRSVLNQSYQDFELIMINHASTDDSRKIAHEFDDKRIVHIDLKKNQGAGGGDIFDEYRRVAKGEYLKFFCADDILYPDCLKILEQFMRSNPQIGFAFGNIEYVNFNGVSFGDDWFNAREGFSVDNDEETLLDMFFNSGINSLPYLGSIIRRSAVEDITVDHSTVQMFDMSLWAHLLIRGEKIGYIDQIVAKYRVHSEQFSNPKNENRALRNSFYEGAYFYIDLLNQCDNIKMIKKLFRWNKYAEKLKEKRDIPFIVSLSRFIRVKDILSYHELHEMLEDREYRDHLVSAFKFDVRELRKIVLEEPEMAESAKKLKWKDYNYILSPSELSVPRLLYLMVRRIYYDIRKLLGIKEKVKKETVKKYTV